MSTIESELPMWQLPEARAASSTIRRAAPVEHEEAAGDERRSGRLLGEAVDTGAIVDELAEPRRRVDPGQRGEPSVRPVKVDDGGDVDVGQAVAVRAQEQVSGQMVGDAL